MEKESENKISLGATLYDMNKQIIGRESALSITQLNKIQDQLETWFNWYSDNYAMLLCRERYDFTVFHLFAKHNANPAKIAAQDLIGALKNRGSILSIEKEIDDNKWEIWLKIDKEVFAYYLFPCKEFIIEC